MPKPLNMPTGSYQSARRRPAGFASRLKGPGGYTPDPTRGGGVVQPSMQPAPPQPGASLPQRRGFQAAPITGRRTDLIDQRKALGLSTQGPRQRYAKWQERYGAQAAGQVPTTAAPMPGRRGGGWQAAGKRGLLHQGLGPTAASGGPMAALRAAKQRGAQPQQQKNAKKKQAAGAPSAPIGGVAGPVDMGGARAARQRLAGMFRRGRG
jgi:hypothetical protein